MVFRYRVLDATSKSKDGFLEAEDGESARRGLELQGFFIVELAEAEPAVLEELARQRAAEEAAREQAQPVPELAPSRWDGLRELAGLPTTRLAFRLIMALCILLIAVQTVRTFRRAPATRPEPEPVAYRFVVRGAVTPGQSQLSFVLPDVPVQFDYRQEQIKSGPDGAFQAELSFSSLREPRRLLVRASHEGYAERQVEVQLRGETVNLSPLKLVAAAPRPRPGLTAEQQRRQKRLAEMRELAKKREAARLLRQAR